MLSDTYEVKSNRENSNLKITSGFGIYDIMLIPLVPGKPGILIEFKKVADQESLEKGAKKALGQILMKNYAQELHARGIHTVLAIGIAFYGKAIAVTAQTNVR